MEFDRTELFGYEVSFPVAKADGTPAGGVAVVPVAVNEYGGPWRCHLVEIKMRISSEKESVALDDLVGISFFADLHRTLVQFQDGIHKTFEGCGTYNFTVRVDWSEFGKDVGFSWHLPGQGCPWWWLTDDPAEYRHGVFCRRAFEFWKLPDDLTKSIGQLERLLTRLAELPGDGPRW